MTTTTTEASQEWQYPLPDTEELVRRLMFAIEEAWDAGSYDRLIEIHGCIQNLRRTYTDALANWEESMTQIMEERGDKKVTAGDIEYRHRRDKRVKCKSNRETLDAVLESLEGDTEKMAELMASNPWKASSVRTVVGQERFDELFTTDYADKVQLKAVDTSQLPNKPKQKESNDDER